ncbi:FAD-dependent oxidoreductase [Streptomyces thermodiastaticus]
MTEGSTAHAVCVPHGGRDRRAGVLPAAPGRRRADGFRPAVAVVGAGIAGLAAATALAERGVAVTLYERQPYVGGRAGGWSTRLKDGTEVTMSRGFHAFFRQYYNLRALLRRTDPALGRLTGLPDYPLLHAGGVRDSFRHLPRTPPFNALAFALLSPTFGVRDLFRLDVKSALPLCDVRVPDVYDRLDRLSAHDYLDAVRFPHAARHLAFEVFSRSFFADPRQLSAAELALMFHIYFLGSSEGLLFDVPRAPYPAALWDPLTERLRRHGVRVRTGTPVEHVAPAPDGRLRVATAREATVHDGVVLALDTAALRGLVARSGELGDAAWRERIARLRTAPPFLVSRLWLDRPVAPDRPGFLATGGFGALDNVSVLDRWEDEARRWAAHTGGSVVELHAYALPDGISRSAAQRHLIDQLHRVYPETRTAGVVDARHEWHADCPLFPVGGYRDRPTVRTPHPRLMVAGDLVRCHLPVALMERAATTGLLAANALLGRWGLQGHPVYTVPLRGRSPVLRGLARRLKR